MSEAQIDIRPDHWAIVRDILQRHVPRYAVWAFGSRAKWTAKEYSDLDLAIITESPLPLATSAALAEDFSESDLPWKVDIVDWAETSETFRQIIERDRVVVQELLQSGISNDRKILPLEDCLDALIDYRGKTPRKTDYGIPLITAKVIKLGRIETPDEFIAEEDYSGWMTRGLPQVGDVVLTTEAPLGEVAQIKFLPVALAQRVVTLRGKKDTLDNGFLLYLLQSHDMQEKIIGRGSGTTVIGIKQSELRKVEIALPPFKEQLTIAYTLGAFDSKIELNRRMNETLEAMARSLFKSWFVDFDVVSAEDMQESELGLIPRDWQIGTLANLAVLNPETWTRQTRPDEVSYVDLSNTKWGRIESITSYIAEEAPSRAQRVLRPDDTIVGTVRPGNGSYALISEEGLTGSTGFAVLRPKRKEYAALVYLAATASENIESLASLADGGAYPAVRADVVAKTPVVIADQETITAFAQRVSPLLEKFAENERQSQALAQLRDTLLPKLISGEVRIKDAERLAETA